MALSGVCEGSFKFPLKNSLTFAQRILVFVQSVKRWAVASSSRLQKEQVFQYQVTDYFKLNGDLEAKDFIILIIMHHLFPKAWYCV